ncbi:MAG: hypothetical protein EOR08_01875 [Mesorhizobium sp.]|nr:MAG: hypothetical protein EOR08_01875 [Mesorhizobium sp.]
MCWRRSAPEIGQKESIMAMNSFEWVDATTVEQAAGLLAESTEQRPVIAKAGEIDLLDLMKEGILAPMRLVNLKTIRGLDEVDTENGLSLGACDAGPHRQRSTGPRALLGAVGCCRTCGDAAGPQRRNDRGQSAAAAALLVFSARPFPWRRCR